MKPFCWRPRQTSGMRTMQLGWKSIGAVLLISWIPVAQADQIVDPAWWVSIQHVPSWVVLIGLALFPLVSEDLTCISAGLLVSQGIVGFFSAILACFLGIYLGDLLLFWAGRHLARPFLKKAPLKWMVKEADILRYAQWFSKKRADYYFYQSICA